MEVIKEKFNLWWPVAQDWLSHLTPIHGAVAGGVLAFLLVVRGVKRARRKKIQHLQPQLVLHAFQIAPLGRDAFFKIRNMGEQAVLSTLQVKGRNDIIVKSDFAGHQIDKDKVYGILLEAGSNQRIQNDFTIEITYIDQARSVYKQVFDLRQQVALQPKLVRAN